MHPIQDLFLESFSYVLQIDMRSYVDEILFLEKVGVTNLPPLEESRPEIQEALGNISG
jgi:hypothetical protein